MNVNCLNGIKKNISQIIINQIFNKDERKSITSDRIVCQL
jgi:hypothetical protein